VSLTVNPGPTDASVTHNDRQSVVNQVSSRSTDRDGCSALALKRDCSISIWAPTKISILSELLAANVDRKCTPQLIIITTIAHARLLAKWIHHSFGLRDRHQAVRQVYERGAPLRHLRHPNQHARRAPRCRRDRLGRETVVCAFGDGVIGGVIGRAWLVCAFT
jgi:hypothetical protein